MSKMTSDNDIFKKQNSKSKAKPLRRCISTTHLGKIFVDKLNLRDTKSTGEMDDKSQSSDENEVETQQHNELVVKNPSKYPSKDVIETKDEFTNEAVVFKADILKQGHVCHSINEVAYKWKKDCRMWLWKNSVQMKVMKSMGYRMRTPASKLKDYAM